MLPLASLFISEKKLFLTTLTRCKDRITEDLAAEWQGIIFEKFKNKILEK